MSAITVPRSAELAAARLPLSSEEIVELAVLLTSREAEALETVAHDQGITTGQMLRQLIRECIDQSLFLHS
jgi:hypothetical protein